VNKFFLLVALATILTSAACTIEVIDDDQMPVNVVFNDYDQEVFLYGMLEVKGADFDTDCDANAMWLEKDGTQYFVELMTCETNSLEGRVPFDIEPGDYTVHVITQGVTANTLDDGTEMVVTVKKRVVVTDVSSNTVSPGGTLVLTGINMINESGNPVYDPIAWFFKTNYTNNVSDVTVNAAGTEAMIVVDEDMELGEYTLNLSIVEFSNDIAITVE
jgi:hypothetical protein